MLPGRFLEAIGIIDLASVFGFGGAPAAYGPPEMGPGAGANMTLPVAGASDTSDIEAFLNGTRARGGPISRGGRYLVGESGPELITASRNGYVHPNGQGPMGRGFEVSINAPITVHGGVPDPQRLAAEISRQMRDEVREAFRGVFADTGMRFA